MRSFFCGKRRTVLANMALTWRISPYILGKFHQRSSMQNVGEIEWQNFQQTLRASNFLRCKQSLVKLTQGRVWKLL